jgi:16S rRNA (cytidine1402-2'-O)-methyltransferase
VARELTKKFEEVVRGTVGEVRRLLAEEPVKGEVVLVVEGTSKGTEPDLEDALIKVRRLREQGLSLKDAAGEVAGNSPGLSRGKLYNAALKQ